MYEMNNDALQNETLLALRFRYRTRVEDGAASESVFIVLRTCNIDRTGMHTG